MQKQEVSVLVGLTLVIGVAALVARSAQQITAPELQLAPEACDLQPTWNIMDDPYNTIRKTERGWDWLSQGYIEMHPCGGGTLVMSGYGVEAGSDWPLLIASLDLEGLGSWKFDRQRSLRVKVPHGGRLSLAFLNNYYSAEQRPIQRRDLHLQEVRWTPDP
ncbi:hypothetical protein [Deinococcus marmoris]|uniref:hypothetical protein n=1 Tax=Deinococcus marmoris TaxID=249408 RepID=UPI0012DCE6A2|nr:hypothetical protein [Deinococcus marmoris]